MAATTSGPIGRPVKCPSAAAPWCSTPGRFNPVAPRQAERAHGVVGTAGRMRQRTGDKALANAAGPGDEHIEPALDPGKRREHGDELPPVLRAAAPPTGDVRIPVSIS